LPVPQIWHLSSKTLPTCNKKMEVHMAYLFLQVDSFRVDTINELQRYHCPFLSRDTSPICIRLSQFW
jgi:hypothetical protein